MTGNNHDNSCPPPPSPPPQYLCPICQLDLQSAKSLEEHRHGRKHYKRALDQGLTATAGGDGPLASSSLSRSSFLPPLDQEEFFQALANGEFQNIVVLTGAGVSTAANIADFRSPGSGLFDQLKAKFSDRFPAILGNPELLLSRDFCRTHPEVWNDEIWPMAKGDLLAGNYSPTKAHRFVAWLDRQGWLRRVYTQNIDGLHTHASLKMDKNKVVECHGSLSNKDASNLVLYGDDLPKAFFDACRQDFDRNKNSETNMVDLLLVMGTSLQVAPFCAVPNLAPRGCVRVLVNLPISDCLVNSFSPSSSLGGMYGVTSIPLGGRKSVSLRPLWNDRKATKKKKWRQLLVELDCEAFVQDFFASSACRAKGYSLEN